jgi:hypothetical protein
MYGPLKTKVGQKWCQSIAPTSLLDKDNFFTFNGTPSFKFKNPVSALNDYTKLALMNQISVRLQKKRVAGR